MRKDLSEDQKIIFLNGFFSAVCCLNSHANYNMIANVTKFSREPNMSLINNLTLIDSTGQNVSEVIRTYRLAEDITKLFPKYSEHFLYRIAASRHYPFKELDTEGIKEILKQERAALEDFDFSHSVHHMFNKLIKEEDEMYRVEFTPYVGANYTFANDTFAICNNERIICIKFGVTD